MINRSEQIADLATALGWPCPGEDELAGATAAALGCLSPRGKAAEYLAAFYDPKSDYAGFTFTHLAPNEPCNVGASDLLAITTMGNRVKASPRAIRNILANPSRDAGAEDEEAGTNLNGFLHDLSPAQELGVASPEVLQTAAVFYEAVKKALGGTNRWVTASKLCARKRPALVPVRDKVVVDLLGLSNQDFRTDLLVYRHLVTNGPLVELLNEHSARAEHQVKGVAQLPVLRRLDTVLWMTPGSAVT